jgi:hypothetical protein
MDGSCTWLEMFMTFGLISGQRTADDATWTHDELWPLSFLGNRRQRLQSALWLAENDVFGRSTILQDVQHSPVNSPVTTLYNIMQYINYERQYYFDKLMLCLTLPVTLIDLEMEQSSLSHFELYIAIIRRKQTVHHRHDLNVTQNEFFARSHIILPSKVGHSYILGQNPISKTRLLGLVIRGCVLLALCIKSPSEGPGLIPGGGGTAIQIVHPFGVGKVVAVSLQWVTTAENCKR